MKAIQKEITKLPNIGNYIKKNDMKWLVFLILPLFLGLIIHFLIPITFILNSNPSAELSYNHEKITLQQQTVRSLSILNSQIIRMKLQRYENIRNFLIRIFGEHNVYEQIIPTQIVLNNAYDIAHMVQNGSDISNITDRSMWYAQGVSNFSQLNQVQQFVYLQYLAVQPFIQTQFVNINNSPQQSILTGITLSANYLNQPLYFAYPSSFNSEFLTLNTSSFDKYYNKTMYNYMNSNGSFEYGIYSEVINGENQMVICNVIFSDNNPAGVACFYTRLTDIAQQLTTNIAIPNITYSTTSYFLLTPIYPILNTTQPQIIFNFTDKNPQNINYPLDTFFPLPKTINPTIYIPTAQKAVNYSFFVTFDSARTIYFQVPINVYSYQGNKETILFLLIKYNFEMSVFNSIAKFSEILKDLSIPSSIVIVASTIISLVILKCLLNSLDDELHRVNEKCEFLLHGDLDLNIPQYENTEQFQPVYKHLRMVNYLHKFSTPSYFYDSPQKQLIKLFKVMQIFKQLNYPIDIVLENIADCYLMIGQLIKAIEFLTQSYDLLVQQVEDNFKQSLTDILRLKHKENKKLSKKYRRLQLKLIARLFKLILMYSFLLIPPPEITFDRHRYTSNSHTNKLPEKVTDQYEKKMRKYLQIFKKLAYPNCVTSETVFAYLFQARFEIEKKNFKSAKTILKRIERIMAEYGNEFQNFQSSSKDDSPVKTYQQMKNNLSSYCKVSPAILWSAYHFIQALFLSQQSPDTHDINQIVKNIKKSLQSNTFAEDIQVRVLFQMIKLSHQYQIEENQIRSLLSSFTFFKQIFPLYHIQNHQNSSELKKLQLLSKIKNGIEKEVIFMFDCSNKWINKLEEFRKWQRQCRQISLKIFNYLQPQDRVSILKVNSSVYISTCCNLIYKKGNQSLITKELSNAIKLKFMSGRCRIVEAIKTAVSRIRLLEEEKYLLIFIKENKQSFPNHLSPNRGNQTQRKEKKMSESSSMMWGKMKAHNFNDSKIVRKNTEVSPHHKQTIHSKAESNFNSLQGDDDFDEFTSNQFFEYYRNINHQIFTTLLNPQIFNLKIVLVTQNTQSFKRKFNLSHINSTLEKQFMKRPTYNNNSLLVLEYQNQDDLERIFKKKTLQRDSQNLLPMF